MSANQPNSEGAGGGTRAVYTGNRESPVLALLRRPRIMLILLAAWSLLGVLSQFFTQSALFFDNDGKEIDGALAGFALGWEGIPLAAVYIYSLGDPLKRRPVFMMALLHVGSLAAAQVYHLGTGDFSFESVVVPLAGSLGLAILVFLHLFVAKEPQAQAVRPG
jgi:hypothetical protein